MQKEKIETFIKQLSKDTINNKIEWSYLYNLKNVSQDSNPSVFFLLFEDEFRHINFDDSFYAPLPNGFIYILNETTESGRDGTVLTGYRIYLQQDEAEKISRISCEQSPIFQLINSINSYLIKEETDTENFIDDYLSNSDQ